MSCGSEPIEETAEETWSAPKIAAPMMMIGKTEVNSCAAMVMARSNTWIRRSPVATRSATRPGHRSINQTRTDITRGDSRSSTASCSSAMPNSTSSARRASRSLLDMPLPRSDRAAADGRPRAAQ